MVADLGDAFVAFQVNRTARRPEPAAVDQHQARDPRPRLGHGVRDDAAAHAVPDQDCAIDGKFGQQGGDIATVRLDPLMGRGPRRCAVAAKVEGHRLDQPAQVGHLTVPVAARAAEAVHEDDGRLPPPFAGMVKHCHGRFLGGGQLKRRTLNAPYTWGRSQRRI